MRAESQKPQLDIAKVNGRCFGRISEKNYSDLKSLDDLITKMGTTKEGFKIKEVGDPDDFKRRFKYFKEFLKKELPELSEEDILKFDNHFHKFRKIYEEWKGVDYFLTAMEYEVRASEMEIVDNIRQQVFNFEGTDPFIVVDLNKK